MLTGKSIMLSAAAVSLDFIAASPAAAQRYYVKVFTGAVLQDDLGAVISEGVNDDVETVPAHYEMDNGFGAGISFGYRIDDFVRVEAEYAYRNADGVAPQEGLTITNLPPDDNIDGHTFFGNVLFDVDTGLEIGEMGWPVVAYIGGGAGVVNVGATLSADTLVNGGETDDTKFAWQGIAGASLMITDKSSIDLEYRYFSSDKLRFDGAFGFDAICCGSDLEATSYESEFTNSNVFIGYRYSFQVAARLGRATLPFAGAPASNAFIRAIADQIRAVFRRIGITVAREGASHTRVFILYTDFYAAIAAHYLLPFNLGEFPCRQVFNY